MPESTTIHMHHPMHPTTQLGLGDTTYKAIDEHGTFELPREYVAHLADAGWKVGKHPKAVEAPQETPPAATEPVPVPAPEPLPDVEVTPSPAKAKGKHGRR